MIKLMAGPALALMMLTGCGGAQKKSAAAGPTCDEVGANARAAWLAGPGDQDPVFAELAPTFGEVVAERCVADAWAPATMACMAKATGAAFETCGKQLTAAQLAALEAALAARVKSNGPQQDTDGGGEGGTGAPPPPSRDLPPPHDPCGGDE